MTTPLDVTGGTPRSRKFFWLQRLDELLRGEAMTEAALRLGNVDFPLKLSLGLATGLSALYGACMGLFALSSGQPLAGLQTLASSLKMPALLLLSLLVTFPSLYVFGTLSGSRLRFGAVLRLLLVSIVVMSAVSASFAPILAFFTLSTTSYSFMVLLNVVMLGIAGLIGVSFLRRALALLVDPAAPAAPSPELGTAAGPPVGPRRAASYIFRVWLVIYGLVGVQMSWLLRPFIGRPGLPFSWFRPREANFFQSVFEHLLKLFGA
jgi:hypothetical protein